MQKSIKNKISLTLSMLTMLSTIPTYASCGSEELVLRVASWEEYIDEGEEDENSLIEDFEEWYYETTGTKVRVDYITLNDNEQMYAKIDKFGRTYDILCPSEYMFMKLAYEGKLEQFDDDFFDVTNPENHYAINVSPYIKDIFDSHTINGIPWSKYAAGYFWGTTGFMYNPDKIDEEDIKSWNIYFKIKFIHWYLPPHILYNSIVYQKHIYFYPFLFF